MKKLKLRSDLSQVIVLTDKLTKEEQEKATPAEAEPDSEHPELIEYLMFKYERKL